MMLRLRNPGGRVPGPLFLAIDELADRLGNGSLRVTTRQAFQMHGVRKENLKEVIGTIVRELGSTLAACGDINRNVMAPAAPFEKGAYPAARKLADDIADLLAPQAAEGSYLDLWVDGELSYRIKPSPAVAKIKALQQEGAVFSGDAAEPLYGDTYLPRKFKVAVTVPGDNSVDLLTQDIGLVLFCDPQGSPLGCNVYVGGGMGRTHNKEETFARTADRLGYVAYGHVLELLQAIVALQRDHGDREQRRHARMKYLIHDRQCGRCLHRGGHGHVLGAGRAEGDGFAGVQIGGDQIQRVRKLAEVVAAAWLVEHALQVAIDLGAAEHAGGNGASEALDRTHQVAGPDHVVPGGLSCQRW